MPSEPQPVSGWPASDLPAPAHTWTRRLIRSPFLPLSAWTGIWFAILARHGGIAWIFFVKGSSLLFDGNYNGHNRPGFMHLYHSYPGMQIGPLAFVLAQVIRNVVPGQPVGPYQGVVLAQLIMSAIGLGALAVIRRIILVSRQDLAASRGFRPAFLAGGAVFMVAWTELAVAYGHLDDALALLLGTCALLAAITGRPVLTGLAIGLAADAKPWALIFLPVLLVTDRNWRVGRPWQDRPPGRPLLASLRSPLIATAFALAAVVAAWLPFFIADPLTIRALHYTIANMPDSGLRALGVHAAATPPWDRSAQVLVACALGVVAIWRRRWPAILLLGAGARIALDPGVHGYYTPDIMVGALLWDLLGTRRPLLAWTCISFFALNLIPLITANSVIRGDFRLYLVVAFTIFVLAVPARLTWDLRSDAAHEQPASQHLTAAPTPPPARPAVRG